MEGNEARDGDGNGARMRLIALLTLAALAGCAGVGGPGGGEPAEDAAAPVRTAEGDVLAPEVFAFSGEGLWDGRPSLGGVWVAHPDAAEPGRVLIRHEGSGAEVTGALFRREGAPAGPPLQVSSDAAEALGMVAAQPAALSVTALKRPETPEADAMEPEEVEDGAPEADPVDPATTLARDRAAPGAQASRAPTPRLF